MFEAALPSALTDILQRKLPPEPWAEGEKIPWDDPAFSARMLAEHLSQEHDAASRRQAIIWQQAAWIHDTLLSGKPSRILDLGCGPGLYCHQLSALGHQCTGVDFSPASIDYARKHASPSCAFVQGDMRTTTWGNGFDLAMLIFGEFNAFRKSDARAILGKVYNTLSPGGLLLLEPHTFEHVQQFGQRARYWYSSPGGLFSAQPHLCLMDHHWHPEQLAATRRHYVIDAETSTVMHYADSRQAYTNDEYAALFGDCGFAEVQFFNAFGEAPKQAGLLVITAHKPH